MSPRPYQLGRRQAGAEQTRARIIDAARDLLGVDAGFGGFTIDAVARQANVARMTVYYQFGSKVGLLEGLCDVLAARGGMEKLAAAFHQSEPLDALAEYVGVFGRFWASDRGVTRRLRALAALDPDIERVIRTRDEWRRKGLRAIVGRVAEQYGRPAAAVIDEAIDILFTLLSFETFDALAGPTRSPEDVSPIVVRLARLALGMHGA
jgi:AcrR family transcriptional regulator